MFMQLAGKYGKIAKDLLHPADENARSTVMTTTEQQDVESERSHFRLAAFAKEPVYLSFSVDGVDIEPTVEELDRGNASFISTKHFDTFYEGQMIGPAVLSLQDEGMTVVYPVVKSKNWPAIHVEFMNISEKDRDMISRFLATCSGGMRPPIHRRLSSAPTAP